MKHKFYLLCLAIVLPFVMVSCDEDDLEDFSRGYLDGSDAAYNGYTLIGSAYSSSDCSDACEARGYDYYRYNMDTELCYCK